MIRKNKTPYGSSDLLRNNLFFWWQLHVVRSGGHYRGDIMLKLEHQIRLRAYELYEARGRKDGHELDDWLRAEEEITSKKVRTVAA